MLSYSPLQSCSLASFTRIKILRTEYCNRQERTQIYDYSYLSVPQFSILLQIYFRSSVVQWGFFMMACLTAEVGCFLWDCMAQKVMGVLCLAKS